MGVGVGCVAVVLIVGLRVRVGLLLGAMLGPSRGYLGPSWVHLGAILGPSWVVLGGGLGVVIVVVVVVENRHMLRSGFKL